MENRRDIVAIGASTGGVTALLELVQNLPKDLPASLFVVIHMSANHRSELPEMLAERSGWRATHPLHGEAIERGVIYVAPPDNHMMLRPGSIEVVRGPKENGHRPAVDALFRTASRAYGSRVIGVVLTGKLDCGTAGLISIKARGGLAVVQKPGEAKEASMPSSAIRHAPVDHVVSLSEAATLLSRLVMESAAPASPALAKELAEDLAVLEGEAPGEPVQIVCPACQGSLTMAERGAFQSFRCHVGHAFSADSLLREHQAETERALRAASRALEDSAAMATRLAGSSNGDMQRRYQEQVSSHTRNAKLIRDLIAHQTSLPAGRSGR